MTEKFLVVFGATFAARAVAAVGNLLLLVAIAQLHGNIILGQFSLGLSILVGAATLARFGSDMSVLRHGSIAWAARDYGRVLGLYQQATRLTLGLSLGLSIFLLLTAESFATGLLDKPDMLPVLRATAIVLPVFPLMFLQSAWLKASGLPQLSPLAEMGGGAFLSAAVVVALNLVGFQLHAAGLIFVFGAAILSIFLAGSWIWRRRLAAELRISSGQSKRDYEPNFLKGLPDYALPSMMTYFSNWGVIFLLGIHADYEQVAALTFALRVVLLIHAASTVITAITAPHFGPLHAKRSLTKLEAMVNRATLLSIMLGGPIALSMMFFPNLWAAIFGAHMPDAVEVIPILAGAQFINVALGPVGILLYMTGNAAAMRRIVLSVSSVGVGGALMAIPVFGIYGAVGVVVFIVCTQNAAAAILVKRNFGFYALPIPNPRSYRK